MLKIGITERGDAGLDFTWAQSLINHKVDGAILITKNINPTFTQYLINEKTVIVLAAKPNFYLVNTDVHTNVYIAIGKINTQVSQFKLTYHFRKENT